MSFVHGAALKCNTKDTQTLLREDKFAALEELVVVIPKFSSDQPVECLKGKFGPFRANVAAKVPFWMALEMDTMQQCTIQLPDWLKVKNLKKLRDDEENSPNRFCEVPEHYIEIALALLTESRTYAHDSNNDKSETLELLRALVHARRLKIDQGLKGFEANVLEKVTNMSAVERTCFRTRSLHAMDYFSDLLAANKQVGMVERQEAAVEEVPAEESSEVPL